MNRLRFTLLSSSVLLTLAAVACGGISDPTRGGEGRVATISGALTGVSIPANARVALVYRTVATPGEASQAAVEVGSDVPVVAGKFTMNLGVPAEEYFSSIDGESQTTDIAPPSTRPLPEPSTSLPPSSGSSTSGGGGAFGAAAIAPRLAPRDIVGGQITSPMSAALAGFVVYADTNGNGKLDLEGQYAASTDQILGGNTELILTYLRDGGALDYEKLRDKSGILPAAGFNLMWTQGRWLPLNVVELKLSASVRLPSAVCGSYGSSWGSSSSGSVSTGPDVPVSDSAGSSSSGSAGTLPSSGSGSGSGGGSSSGSYPGTYPSPTDPGLHCSPDGRSFMYTMPSDCPPSPPPPVGLCAGDVYETAPCASGGYGTSLSSGQPIPEGWPCPVDDALDGGAADASVDGSFDGGVMDSSVDAGVMDSSVDAGSAPDGGS